MVKCLIFDFDGLIIDTETFELKAFEEIYRDYNLSFNIEAWNQSVGSKLTFNPYETLLTNNPNLTKEAIEEEYSVKFKHFIDGVLPREGVVNYLKRGKELGLKLAIASSSPRSWINEHIKNLGITQYFDFICTSDDVTNIKPDPELYVKVLDFFGIHPNEAIVFEDSPNGSLAAINADIPCVVVPNYVTNSLTFDRRVSLRLNSKSDMSLDEVIEKIKST